MTQEPAHASPSSPKHTPGPWHAECYEDTFYVFASEGGMVADNGGFDRPVLARMRGVGRGATYEEMEANAELMAAAPELRESLKWALGRMVNWTLGGDSVEAYTTAAALLARLEKEKP